MNIVSNCGRKVLGEGTGELGQFDINPLASLEETPLNKQGCLEVLLSYLAVDPRGLL